MKSDSWLACGGAVASLLTVACGPAITGGAATDDVILLADEPIAFDDIGYAPAIDRVLAPARGHGLKLVEPATLEVTSLAVGDADSVAAGHGFLFVLDRGAAELRVIDDVSFDVVHTAAIGGDYVRYVEASDELWVTQPFDGRIMVLSVNDDGSLTFESPIMTSGGPEGLVVDDDAGLAVAHSFAGEALFFDTARREMKRSVSLGCFGAHGVPALDAAGGFALFGCRDAELVSMGLDEGDVRGRYHLGGGGESLMAFDPATRKAFLRGDPGDVIAVIDVGEDGSLTQVGARTATERGHCLLVAAGSLWACDEMGGGLLRFDITAP